ncbi:MAG: PTS sugar transporter subunit IIA [Phycisphaeraceae bacterium]|nr:PTS sugar transporter subunit IIA [Phycisphaeraceae bacterium]
MALKLTDIVAPGAVVAELNAAERDEAIQELVDALVEAGAANAEHRDALVAAVLERERKGSTGFGRGVAVPHVKHPGVTKMTAAIGRSPHGIDFSALDRQPVYSIVLLLSPDNNPEDHLRAMEVIFKSLGNETFRRFLRQAATRQDILELLNEADHQKLPG